MNEAFGPFPNKQIHQIVTFLGTGKLRDGNATSVELRHFLMGISPEDLQRHARACLETAFADSGLVLQDIVNEIGSRLGFHTVNGNYRGSQSNPAPDGTWSKDGHFFVLEVKTTDAYRIDLDRLEVFRRSSVNTKGISEDKCSILLIVGRDDTGGLEAQIRGSRHAWSTRLLSLEGLLTLLELRVKIDSDEELAKINKVLIPREYTKVDNIIDLVFSVTQAKEQEAGINPNAKANEVSSYENLPAERAGKQVQEMCLLLISKKLGYNFLRHSATRFRTAKDDARLVLSVSRPYQVSTSNRFWFAFHAPSVEFLDGAQSGWAAFGCGFDGVTALLPWTVFKSMLGDLNQSLTPARPPYWHVAIIQNGNKYVLRPKSGSKDLDLTTFMLLDPHLVAG